MKTYFAEILFDGRDLMEKAALLVEKDRILWVGPEAELGERCCLSDEAERFVFLMPGLIDCHVHLALSAATPSDCPAQWAQSGVNAAANLRLLARAGVVACRDLGSAGGLCLGIARAQKAGQLPGTPFLQAAGPALCATGGHGFEIGLECDGADAFTRGCRSVIKEGADLVKVMMSGGVNSPGEEAGPAELTQEELDAVVREAHARGRKVAVHAHGNTAIRRSVLAKVDSVEHGVFNSEDILAQMLKQGTALVPTLSAPYYAAQEGLRQEPEHPDHQRSQEVTREHNAITRRAFEMGVWLCMGTDAGCPFNPYERAFYELVLLNGIGIDAREVLRIATLNGARLLGLEDRLGSLEAGKEASFLALANSPLEDMTAICGEKQLYIKGEKVV